MNWKFLTDRNKLFILISLLIYGVYILFAFTSLGFHQVDEYYQIIEFGRYRMGLDSGINLPWEYHARLRPTLQPVLFIGIYKICLYLGIHDPYQQMFVLRLISSLISFTALLFLVRYALKEFNIPKKWDKLFIIFPVLLMWYVPYVSVRFSSENWSTAFFIYGFIMNEYLRRKTKSKWYLYILSGILFGMAYEFRFQIILMITGYFLWVIIIKNEILKNQIGISLGILLSLSLGICIDSWFYGEFTVPSWNYLKINLLQNENYFGTSPWYFYFTRGITDMFYPIGILILVALIYMFVKNNRLPYIWIIIPFLIFHTIIKHKEIRFLFCVLPFLHIITGYFLYLLWKGKIINKSLIVKIIRPLIIILLIFNIFAIIPMACKPAGVGYIGMTKYLHQHIDNRKLNLIAFPYSSPYSPWKNPQFPQYAKTDLNQFFIDNITQLNDSLIIPGCVNYLVIRDYDLTPETKAKIEGMGFELVKTSVPLWVVNLSNFFMGEKPRTNYLFKFSTKESQ